MLLFMQVFDTKLFGLVVCEKVYWVVMDENKSNYNQEGI